MAETADTRAAAMRWPDVSDRTLRRTKIVCTLGPSTDPPGRLTDLATTGLDVARLNFSHGTLDAHLQRIHAVQAAREATGKPIAILADLQGPKLRVGVLPEPVTLARDETVVLAGAGAGREGDLELGFELDMAAYLRRGRPVMINDGLVRLRVEEVEGPRARCRVEVGGVVSSQKGVNLPGTYLPIPSITEQDRENLVFAVEHDVDFVALSFVRRAEDVEELRQLIKGLGGRQRVIAKIEKTEAVEQLDAIIAVTDGLMVARGDLGVEMGAAQVPLAQKRIILRGREVGKPV